MGDLPVWSFDDDAKAEFRPTTVEARICLDGDLIAEIERLEAELPLVQAEDERHNREPESVVLAERIVELNDQARAKERPFVFAALGRRAWTALVDEYPPTPADEEAGRDYDGVRFPTAAIAACCVNPKLTLDDAEWLADNLSLGQFLRLQRACLAANVGAGGVGKAPSVTAAHLADGPRSTSPVDSVSPEASS